jgi:hypothetical protein
VFYLLLIGIGGILAHLASEFAAMGSGADQLLFSARHYYLGLGVAFGMYVFVSRGLDLLRKSSGRRDFKRLLSVGLGELPFGGRGIRFYALTAGLQFAVGSLTEIGEGCPFCSHDVVAGLLGALATVLALALIARTVGRKLPSLVGALIRYVPHRFADRDVRYVRPQWARTPIDRDVWFPLLFNRPPPYVQFLNASS